MEMNQDTLEKMLGMNLKGMYYAFKTSLETHRTESMTTDQFVSWLVSSEWDDRRNRAVERAIRQVMEEKKHPEQAYKSCQGILSFARRVGNTRLTNACRWATSYGLYNYPIIERILNNRQDEFPLEDSAGQETEMPSHENIRGKEYYQ